MATRSIKLKLALGRSEDKADLRKAVWTTHRLFNEGVAYYMNWLMLMRQETIDDEDAPVGDILALAREAQRRNGNSDCPGKDEEVCGLLRKLYAELNPSSVGETGDANQIGRNYLSSLVDPESEGGMGTSPGGRKPKWMTLEEGPERDAKQIEWEERRRKSLEESARPILKQMGVLPLFDAFNKTFSGWHKDIKRTSKNAILTTWDRDMFQQALERLMSWESWNRRVKEEREKKRQLLENLKQRYFDPEPEWHQRLKRYERERSDELDVIAFESQEGFRLGSRTIRGWERLRERWLAVLEKDRSEKRLLEVLATLQTEMRGGLGDASHFYRWLCLPDNQNLWNESAEGDPIREHVAFNEARRDYDNAKEFANYTPPDALEHPLWARSGHSGDMNIHNYFLTEEDGHIRATLRLLHEAADGKITERDESLALRPSGQWNRAQRGEVQPLQIVKYQDVPDEFKKGNKNEPKCTWVRFVDPGTGKTSYGTLGGARLQLERSDFRLCAENKAQKAIRQAQFAEGRHFPRAYLNVTVSLGDPEENASHRMLRRVRESDTEPLSAVDFNLRADGKKYSLEDLNCDGDSITDGLRILSVDLGLRQFAACSSFELTRKPPKGKLAYPVAGAAGLWMEHRRSFLVKLDGEEETPEIRKVRDAIVEERLDLRAAVRRLSALLSLGRLDEPEQKREALKALQGVDAYEKPERRKRVDAILKPELLKSLEPLSDKAHDPRWPGAVLGVHNQWERELGKAIGEWRKKGRERGRRKDERGYGGLSLWHLEELIATRKLMNSWSCHSRTYEDRPDGTRRPAVVRAKKRFGLKPGEVPQGQDIDERLLSHINRHKEDRMKVGADRLVMAALGYEYRDKEIGWEQVHSPCQMVLFEDLSRYRFKTDRPRRENSMLMNWSHREIPRTVAMQGELHGVTIGHVSAEFSSRFRASSKELTPGIRCRRVSAEDLASDWFKAEIERRIQEKELERPPKEGDLIPWDGGEWFCTLGEDKTLFSVNADINAAQNLMRRFWTRYTEVFRMPCRQVTLKDGRNVWAPRSLGKRLSRALETHLGQPACVLVPLGDTPEEGCRWEAIAPKAIGAKAAMKKDDTLPDGEVEESEIAEARGEILTFFRDPSAVIIPGMKDAQGNWVGGESVWLPSKAFWGRVKRSISSNLLK